MEKLPRRRHRRRRDSLQSRAEERAPPPGEYRVTPQASCIWCWRRDAYRQVGLGAVRCRFCLRPRFPELEGFGEWLEAVEAWRKHTGEHDTELAEAEADWRRYVAEAGPCAWPAR